MCGCISLEGGVAKDIKRALDDIVSDLMLLFLIYSKLGLHRESSTAWKILDANENESEK